MSNDKEHISWKAILLPNLVQWGKNPPPKGLKNSKESDFILIRVPSSHPDSLLKPKDYLSNN